MIRKTHQQGRAILQPCKFFKVFDYTTGSAQPQITIDNIKDIEINIPTDDILSDFNSALAPVEKKYFEILAENERLIKLRDTLLPELLNGRVDVSNIDI